MQHRSTFLRSTLAVAALLAALPAATLGAEELAPFTLPSLRSTATGGPHVTPADDFFAIFENPAGFAGQEGELSAALLNLHLAGPVFDMLGLGIGLFQGASFDLSTALSSMLDDDGRLYAVLDLGGPVGFGWVGQGLGFGVFDRTSLVLNVAGVSAASAALTQEFLLSGGYAFRLPLGGTHTLDLGLQLKGFLRGSVDVSGSLSAVAAVLGDPATLLGAHPVMLASGVGIDAGLIYSWNAAGLAFGLAARDAWSPARVAEYVSLDDFMGGAAPAGTSVALVEPDLSVDLVWDPRLAFLERLDLAPRLVLGYKDLLDLFAAIPRNPILQIGAGFELVILDILSLRAGIADALPNLGLAVDLSVFRFGLSVYGTELGLDPGVRTLYNILMSFEFRY
ncbi:MAG: hypothetical protein JXA15_02725 [Spirochaetales bacterium]|nr:hypothetical protein [Spirochaetales bacterium]